MPLFRTAAITDEFSPDIEIAVRSMAEIGMTGAELRMVFGKNIMDLTDEELDRAIAIVRGAGHGDHLDRIAAAEVHAAGRAGGGPAVPAGHVRRQAYDSRTSRGSPRGLSRSRDRTGARIIRVFSYWRTVRPEKCFDRIVDALGEAGRSRRRQHGSDHRARERARLQHRDRRGDGARPGGDRSSESEGGLGSRATRWSPGESPFPGGLRQAADVPDRPRPREGLPRDGHKPTLGPVGEGGIDWKGQIAALERDGYRGWISLETHWPGPGGEQARGEHDLRPQPQAAGRGIAGTLKPSRNCIEYSRAYSPSSSISSRACPVRRSARHPAPRCGAPP